jgi:hypothetical protein
MNPTVSEQLKKRPAKEKAKVDAPDMTVQQPDFYFEDIVDKSNPDLSAERLQLLQDFMMKISAFIETLPMCLRVAVTAKTVCQLAVIASIGNELLPDLTQGYHRDFGGNFYRLSYPFCFAKTFQFLNLPQLVWMHYLCE